MPKGKRRGNKSGAGHKSRQDVPSSDEDSLDNASIISNFSESRSVMEEGTSEEVDEQTQEEVFEEKLKEAIDGINQKSAQGRTMSLEAVSKAFVKKFIPEFIVDRRLTVTDGIERSLRKGRGAEQAAAAQLASLLCLQLGGGDVFGLAGGDVAGGSADQAFRDLRPVLITLANDNAATYPARAKCCMALGLCSFVSGGELQEVIELMCTLENIFWLASSSSVQASNPEAATLYSAALSAWGLLLTLMAPRDVYSLMGRQLSRLVTLLESASLDVRIAAGEAIAVATELGREHDADFTVGGKGCDNEDLIETLRGLATDSHKYRAKKDRKQQRSSFRDILHFVEDGVQPDVQVKFGQEMLALDSWCRKKQYDAFCQVLGPGMNLHLTENYLVREIFELGERVTLLNGAVYKASKLERLKHFKKWVDSHPPSIQFRLSLEDLKTESLHLLNAANFKARTILRSKNRDKRSAAAM